MKSFLVVFCSLFSCLLYGADQSKDTSTEKPWKTLDGKRPWNKWYVTSGDESTWYEWWHGFRVKREGQYARAIIEYNKEDTTPIPVMDTFKGHKEFRQDPGQAHWLNFCEKKTQDLLNTPTDKLTLYQLEEFFDCCGTHIKQSAEIQAPQKYKNIIELVDSTEKAIIALKAFESKIKSQQ